MAFFMIPMIVLETEHVAFMVIGLKLINYF
jgi:hypothetical protein